MKELSENNRYYVNKNRRLELKYFCLQYSRWKKEYESLNNMLPKANHKDYKTSDVFDPTAKYAVTRAYYDCRIKMIEDCCKKADPELFSYILKGVTQGLSYDVMNVNDPIPCSKDTYYDRYRKFFFILNHERG